MMSQDQIVELTRAVGRIEGKLDGVLEERESLRTRLGSLERWRAWTTGVTVAALLLLNTAWKLFHG